MDSSNRIVLSRPQLAAFLSIVTGTLAVWKSTKRYDLKCFEKDGEIFYHLSTVNKFLGVDENDTDIEPLLTPKDAAKYLSRYKHVSTRTLSHWEKTKSHDLKPIHAGRRMVRYRKRELDKFGQELLKPN